MSYLGLDIGTSGCKAVVFEKNGNMLGTAYESYDIINKAPMFAELDSNEVMEKCFCVIRKAVKCSNGSPVQAMSISSQGEAITPVGANGKIIGNAMVSSDCRASSIVEPWTKEFGAEKLYKITGHTAYSMFSLFKLLWVKKNQPELWSKTKSFYCFEDLMHSQLGLNPAMSWPLAGRTMMFDINTHQWNEDILDAVGLRKSQLARTLKTGSIVGVIPDNIAKDLGLNSNVKVVTGGHDQTVGALGGGVVKEGLAMYATGTVECICPVFSSLHISKELRDNNLCCYDFTLDNKYATVAYCLTGGNILQWFKNEFATHEIPDAKKANTNIYDYLIEQMDDKPTDLLVLPYFTPTGTPYFDIDTPGAILGLRLTTKRNEILKALLEGVIFEMKLNLDIMERSGMIIDKFIATGGGAVNQIWTQLKADILNKPISVVAVREVGCFGAAMIACSADTGKNVTSLVTQNMNELMLVEPQPKVVEIYNQKFEKYKKLYSKLKV